MSQGIPFSLNDRVVILFGASGLLGDALRTTLSRAGSTLIVTSRDVSKLEAMARNERSLGRLVYAAEADPTSESSIVALRDLVIERHHRIDGLVYNAIRRTMKTATDDIALWKDSMESNATGLFRTNRTFGDVMAKQKKGSIVNISSIQGIVGMSPWLYEGTTMTAAPDYFFHKAGMINLTRYWASYYGPHGVRVNVVAPGGILDHRVLQPEIFRENYGRLTALGRLANPDEIGGAVVFLLSDAASYVTGAVLPVDGGYTAR